MGIIPPEGVNPRPGHQMAPLSDTFL